MTMLEREPQSENALSPMLVTLEGMTISDRERQSENALLPMLVTLEGITILDRESQSQYLQPIITQYFIDNKSEIWLLFLIAHSKR